MSPNLEVCKNCSRHHRTDFEEVVQKCTESTMILSCRPTNNSSIREGYIWHLWIGLQGQWLENDVFVPKDCPYQLEHVVSQDN